MKTTAKQFENLKKNFCEIVDQINNGHLESHEKRELEARIENIAKMLIQDVKKA